MSISVMSLVPSVKQKKNPSRSFVKSVPVTSYCQISLLFEFMLYLTLNNDIPLMNVFISTLYFCKLTFMNTFFFAF